jgi:hypothetical protein
MTDDKKIVEYDFDRMRDVISKTWLPIKNANGDVTGETRLGTGDVFRIAAALINDGFCLARSGKWLTDKYGLGASICSICDATFEGDGGSYCSNCGAKMIRG